ncbi:hypothetical protein, variant 2 [Aphanomyces astaci]|uniref:Uncharacterized protein n=1 Tax=Aphanomyces astaci TaxID=112090 RepID=W4H5J0_APHAT|nr:hypothetical protein, variant 2 [Aphanomyces astaci]ETV87167.1 hypothetical protein, variant 2 [Aphanomyces astaci]|eukprot:XP_009823965.1 hypothetical protein, variant 2 [Aphanomyces astaci]
MGYQSLGPRHYGHWKRKDVLGPSGGRLGLSRSVEGSLSHQIQQLLPVLMGARDYRGAAGVLSVIYTHLMSDPAACVTTSLEILRRLPDSTPTLVEFYQSLLEWQSDHISNDVILRERFLLYLLQGDLHEAYAYYKEHMQLEVLQQDIHVIASFGMVCYWLLFREDQAIRDAYIHAPLSSQSNDDGDNDDIMDNDQETQFPIRHVVGTATLYQEASVSFRRAMTLSPESNVFVEYYVQILVMKNDIELAADYLEHFYHLHPTEPHACRMLFEFFQRYFPASVASHVDICIRWNTLDPSTLVPLKALVECFAQDLVTKGQLVASLCHSLDHCGSNMYQQLHPDTTLWIWQQLADVLGPVSLPPLSQHVALYFEPRQWWRRVYTTNTSSANELTLLNVLQCIVFVRVWGVEALSHTLELATLVHSPHHDVATLATRFHLDSLTRQPTRQPASPSSLKCIGLPVVRTLSQPLSWRPSIGQLRTPHLLKRPQVLTSFELEDAVQVHQVATGAAPPPCRIPRPVNNTIDARVTLESSQSKHQQQHPMDWLLGQRSRQTNPWHMDMTSSVLHAIQTDTSSSSTGGLVLTDKDCFAAAMEDELLLVSPPSTAPLHHLHTSYLYKCLPVPPSSQQAGIIVKALRRYHPFLPQYRIPARFLHWIQHYMMRHGLHATSPKCLEHVESKWRRQYGRCRGLPSIEAVAAAMDYFKRNPVILPRRIRDRFRAFVSAHGRVNLLHLCRVFYTLLGARYPPDLPFSSVLVATARQWMQDGDPRGSVGTALACYPPPVIHISTVSL